MDSPEELQVSTHHISNSVVWFLLRIIAGLFLIELSYAVIILIIGENFGESFNFQFNLTLLVIKFILEIIFVFYISVAWGAINYYLSRHQLIKYTGLSRRDDISYDLNSLKSVELHKGFLGRVFNYGDLTVTFSSSGYHEKINMHGIYNPKKYERVFREKLEEAGAKTISVSS